MERFVIFGSRPVGAEMLRYVEPGARLIAVDAGWQSCAALGLVPELVQGDFDSAPPPPGARVVPSEKDDTDTMLAVKTALALGAQRVTILGGLGGRADHTYANLQALDYLAQNGAENLLADEDTEVRCVLPGEVRIAAQAGRYLSIFAKGGTAHGVTLEGVKYPLREATLTPDVPLGVSNEFFPGVPHATVRHTQGRLLIFTTRMEAAR